MQLKPVSLLCLPCAGASAVMYARWQGLLPSWIGVVPLELPGRGHRLNEPLLYDYEELVGELCNAYLRMPSRCYALFGHSMGGLLAYGMAQRLQLEVPDQVPMALMVSACAAPTRRDTDPHLVGSDDHALTDYIRRQGGTPDEVFSCPELMDMILGILRADFQVCKSFRRPSHAPLQIPLRVLAGRSDRFLPEKIEAWNLESAAGCVVDWFDGGHFFIQNRQSQVLDVIERHLRLLSVDSAALPVSMYA